MCRHRHLLRERISSRNTIITHVQKRTPKSAKETIDRIKNPQKKESGEEDWPD